MPVIWRCSTDARGSSEDGSSYVSFPVWGNVQKLRALLYSPDDGGPGCRETGSSEEWSFPTFFTA